ncbi:unnamed protein product [Gordionus sp. m RMFG-2023]
MAGITGKYQLISSKNFDEYMQELGVGLLTRKMADAAKPVTTIEVNGDEWTIKTDMLFKSTTIKFKLGQEFEEDRADGTKCKSIITRDGEKLIHNQKSSEGGKDSSILREFHGDEMDMVIMKSYYN